MKKLVIILLIITFFIMGLKLGDNNFNQNQLFEEEKNQFEEEIKKPDNEYDAIELTPKPNMVNKVAKKFDQTIDKFFATIKNFIKKL